MTHLCIYIALCHQSIDFMEFCRCTITVFSTSEINLKKSIMYELLCFTSKFLTKRNNTCTLMKLLMEIPSNHY